MHRSNRSKILPAIFLAVPAAVLLTAQAGFAAPAAQDCKAKPGAATPRGTHWYYHVNQADKQRCWYLGALDSHAEVHAAAPGPAGTAESPAGQPAETAATDAAAAASPFGAAPTSPGATAPGLFVAPSPVGAIQQVDFVGRWPEQLRQAADAGDTVPAVASNSYAEDEAADDMRQMPPQLSTPEGGRPAEGSLVAEAALRYFSVAGGLAIPLLLLAGWAARFARRVRPAPMPDRDAEIEASRWRPQTLTDPADDLKKSLAELMADLRRAAAAAEAKPRPPASSFARDRDRVRPRVAARA